MRGKKGESGFLEALLICKMKASLKKHHQSRFLKAQLLRLRQADGEPKKLDPLKSAIWNSKTEVTLLLAFVGLLLSYCSAFAEKADIFFSFQTCDVATHSVRNILCLPNTVKLDFKELLNKEQIDFKELFTDYQPFYTINLLLNKELLPI